MSGWDVLYFGDRRGAGAVLEPDVTALRRDLSFFIVGYSFAVAAAFVPSRAFRVGIALGLVGRGDPFDGDATTGRLDGLSRPRLGYSENSGFCRELRSNHRLPGYASPSD